MVDRQFNVVELAGSNPDEELVRVAEGVDWNPAPPDTICGIRSPGGRLAALALRRPNDEMDIDAVLVFTDLAVGRHVLPVPSGLEELSAVTDRPTSLQNPHVAKILGVLGGNEPPALASHFADGTHAAVRTVPVRGLGDVCVFPDADQSMVGGIRGHWRMWQGAEAEDRDPSEVEPGITDVVRSRAARVGDRRCVFFPLSPLSRAWQRAGFISSGPIVPAHIAVNGLANRTDDPPLDGLESIGTAPIPQPSRLLKLVLSEAFGRLPS